MLVEVLAMTDMNLEKILRNRVKLLLNFFFNVKCWSVLIFLILLVLGCVASYFTIEYSTIHIICGAVTGLIFLFLLFRHIFLSCFIKIDL